MAIDGRHVLIAIGVYGFVMCAAFLALVYAAVPDTTLSDGFQVFLAVMWVFSIGMIALGALSTGDGNG